jgi:hypothetical protein
VVSDVTSLDVGFAATVSGIAVFCIDVTTFVTRVSCDAAMGTSTASAAEMSIHPCLP